MTDLPGASLASLEQLQELGVLPAACRSVYISGSLVRGWGNALSDVDIYVITEEDYRSETAVYVQVPLEPDTLPVEIKYVDGRRWDIEYWRTDQIQQVISKVDWSVLEGTQEVGRRLSTDELDFLERLSYAYPLTGADWLGSRQKQLADSGLRSVMVARALNSVDTYTQDVVGQLEAGDVESSVLSVKIAFGYAMDALLAFEGEYGQNAKWRARRFRTADPTIVTFDQYWAIETMQSFDPSAPRAWVEEALRLCQHVSMEVSV
ncbi:hypothetical protein P8A18_04865 [Streptomyces castrisilvae]|uniref:Polymerase nucleotidyl transferase domain-containing protein n=1 Tax=Streptomyces castrisilvae TaxID=3033811 RepID=A0ABY9HGY1_9ACTN|nr:hypothetical protein [Streptomyces sp. Mut1]WLQ32821.1 hypothetical protein P8A18_04865 [Streptomyces sp. Mut1]